MSFVLIKLMWWKILSSSERRKTPRKRLRLPVQYGTKELNLKGFTTDISPGGIGIKTNRPLPPGTEILTCIDMDGELLLARGEVKWARRVQPSLVNYTECGMEIKFNSFNKRFMKFLKTWYDKADLPLDNAP